MLPKLNPRNNEWNRKYDFTNENKTGFLVNTKIGLAFFGWKSPGEAAKFYKCEQELFNKSFEVTMEMVEQEIDPEVAVKYLRYPVEI